MTEALFWLRLEYRVCRELAGLRQMAERGYWCDGFIPESYRPEAPEPSIRGRAWMARGQETQERWRFCLRLDRRSPAIEAIDWASLLPPDDATGWLEADLDRQHLLLDPAATVPIR